MAAQDPSKKLGEKLIQGWCMLDKTCDNCYIPIMRDRNNREYCVGCETYLDQPKTKQSQVETKKTPETAQITSNTRNASDLQNSNPDLSSAVSQTKTSILASMSFHSSKLQESSDLQYR